MIKLYNHTKLPDQLLRDIFNFASRCSGAKGDVPVKVTPAGYTLFTNGMMHSEWPYRKTLIGKPTTSKDRRHLKCPIGWISCTVLDSSYEKPNKEEQLRQHAERFVDMAIHEMRHIYQTRNNMDSLSFRGYGENRNKRVRHENRPCEIDAENAVYDVHHHTQRNKRRIELVENLYRHLVNL